MLETHKIELEKLQKQYKTLKILLIVFIILTLIGMVTFAIYYYKVGAWMALRKAEGSATLFFGIPALLTQKKMKKIDARIAEIDSIYLPKKNT